MVNWKTTLFGLLGAIGLAFTQVPQLSNNKTIQVIGTVLSVAGVAGNGLSGKDKNVTGAGSTAKSVPSGS